MATSKREPADRSDVTFDASVGAARAAGQRGELDRWVDEFLASPGSDNAALAEELHEQRSSWCGPVRLRFDELHRLAGPPEQPTLDRLDQDDRETVDGMQDSVDDGWMPPPLIVSYRDGQLCVEDGNHRIEGLRRCGHSEYWSVVGFDNGQQRSQFLSRFLDGDR